MNTLTESPELARYETKAKPSRQRTRRLHNWRAVLTVTGERLIAAAIVLGLWQHFAGGPTSFLPIDVLSRPTAIASTFGQLFIHGQLLTALGSTVLEVAYSMVIAAPLGILLALATLIPVGRWLLEPIVTITYAIPKIGLVTVYILVFGLTTKTHLILVVGAVMYVYFYSVQQAIREFDRNTFLTVRLMGASRVRTARVLLLKSAAPQLFAATRASLPLAFAVEIFAELRVPSSPGLGTLLVTYTQNLNAPGAMAVLLFTVLIGYVIDTAVAGYLRRYTASIGQGIVR